MTHFPFGIEDLHLQEKFLIADNKQKQTDFYQMDKLLYSQH